jgi:hypothetical protein
MNGWRENRGDDFRLEVKSQQRRSEMAMMKGSGGGGYGSRPHVEKPVKTGTGSKSARPAGVAQIGTSIGDHITNKDSTGYRGERLHNPERNFQPVPFGNSVALNVGTGGCGTGRTLYGQAGSQGTHGTPDRGVPGLPSTKGQWPDSNSNR